MYILIYLVLDKIPTFNKEYSGFSTSSAVSILHCTLQS